MPKSQPLRQPIKWSDIETKLDNLFPIEGGFSQARKGLVRFDDGTELFVKIGCNSDTCAWAKKEIYTYRFLRQHNYPYIPELIAVNPDESGFALSVHKSENGWDWKDNWDDERLSKTVEAMDRLASIKPTGDDLAYYSKRSLDESHNGWRLLLDSPELQQKLIDKLCDAGRSDIANRIDFISDTKQSERFVFSNDILIHNDLRADNCAWSSTAKEVRLVDWNWAQIGDSRIEFSARLTHIYKSGFDILPKYTNRLDADALHWLAGFWLKSSTAPVKVGVSERLRYLQLLSGVAALDLRDRL